MNSEINDDVDILIIDDYFSRCLRIRRSVSIEVAAKTLALGKVEYIKIARS